MFHALAYRSLCNRTKKCLRQLRLGLTKVSLTLNIFQIEISVCILFIHMCGIRLKENKNPVESNTQQHMTLSPHGHHTKQTKKKKTMQLTQRPSSTDMTSVHSHTQIDCIPCIFLSSTLHSLKNHRQAFVSGRGRCGWLNSLAQ